MDDVRRKDEGMIKVTVRGYQGQGAGSKWIQKWTRSDVSHTSLVFHMGHSVEEVESIQFRGTISHKPHSHKKKTFIEYDVPMTYEQVLEARELALSLVGSRYDWQGVWGFVKHRKKHSLNKFFCSELVAYCLLKAGYPLSRRAPFLETPATVCQSLRLVEQVNPVGGA
jgi:uncharacterized protein YycO